jgi:hypothetical protein
MPFDHPPPWVGQRIHRMLREATGDRDPYRAAKRRANELALSLLPELEQHVRDSADPLATAARLAIAGNIIDHAFKSEVTDEEIHAAIAQARSDPLDARALEDFRAAVQSADRILYLADNAGEIVLDRLLIERLPMERVTLAVRGSPVINDATRQDADAAGLSALVEVIDNGSDVPGTILEVCSAGFREAFERADVVVAKGQGNYETLNDAGEKVFFLLRVKCLVAARDIGCDVGRAVLWRGRSSGAARASRQGAALEEH